MDDSSAFSTLAQKLIRDPNVWLFADREFRKSLYTRLRRKLSRSPPPFTSFIWYQHYFVQRAKFFYDQLHVEPKAFIRFASAPHSLESYIYGQVAEFLSIPTYYTVESRVQGFYFLASGIQREPRLVNVNALNQEAFENAARCYFNLSEGSYSNAIPEYEKQRFARNSGKYFSLKHQLLDNGHRPKDVFNAYRCWHALNRISVGLESIKNSYVVFFLHYQPERTSLPEGYGYTQQSLAIRALREALPANIQILVKEHPSIFTNRCDPAMRWPGFYEDLTAIGGVSMVSIDTDNFKLLDSAVCSATLSGTVTTESLLRGIPTVIFGVRKWLPTLGQYQYSGNSSLRQFLLQRINERGPQISIRESVIKTIIEQEVNYAITKEQAKDRKFLDELIFRDLEVNRVL
jgi:hypothetical protein